MITLLVLFLSLVYLRVSFFGLLFPVFSWLRFDERTFEFQLFHDISSVDENDHEKDVNDYDFA